MLLQLGDRALLGVEYVASEEDEYVTPTPAVGEKRLGGGRGMCLQCVASVAAFMLSPIKDGLQQLGRVCDGRLCTGAT